MNEALGGPGAGLISVTLPCAISSVFHGLLAPITGWPCIRVPSAVVVFVLKYSVPSHRVRARFGSVGPLGRAGDGAGRRREMCTSRTARQGFFKLPTPPGSSHAIRYTSDTRTCAPPGAATGTRPPSLVCATCRPDGGRQRPLRGPGIGSSEPASTDG